MFLHLQVRTAPHPEDKRKKNHLKAASEWFLVMEPEEASITAAFATSRTFLMFGTWSGFSVVVRTARALKMNQRKSK